MIITLNDISIKYNGNDMIILTLNKDDDKFVIPTELINCKNIFDFVTEYFNNINNFNKIIVSDIKIKDKLILLKW